MRILVVGALDCPHVRRWTRGLSGRGHRVTVFSVHRPPDEPLPADIIPAGGAGRLDYLRCGPALRRTVAALRPHRIHAFFASGYGLLCALFLKRGSYLLSAMGSDIQQFPSDRLRRRLLSYSLSRPDRVLCASGWLRHETVRYTDRPVDLLPFGVDTVRFRPARPEGRERAVFRIGTAKALQRHYGIDTLLEAFAIFRRRLPDGQDAELRVAGDGPERARLEQTAADLGCAAAVRFFGRLPNDRIPEFLNRLDVCALLSRREAFGVAAVEAAACALPVVAARVGGLPEAVRHGVTGYLAPPDDPGAAADCFTRLYGDAGLRRRLGQQGREFALRHYDLQQCLTRLESIYRDASPPRPGAAQV